MVRRFWLILLPSLLSLAPLCAQDNGFFFHAAVRVTISRAPFNPDIDFYGSFRMHDLQFPVANPEYKAWWQVELVPEDPAMAAQLAKLTASVFTGHVIATGTHAGHMILQFSSAIGNWRLDITPMDSTLRQSIAALADDPSLNGDAGIQTLTFMVGSDSLSVTAMQLAAAEGPAFFWKRPSERQ